MSSIGLITLFNVEFSDIIRKKLSEMTLIEINTKEELDSHSFYIVKKNEKSYPIIYVSEKFCQLTNYKNYDIIGSNPGMFNGPKTDKDKIISNNEKIKEGLPYSSCNFNYKRNGIPFYCESKFDYIKNNKGEIIFIIVLYDSNFTKEKLELFINDLVLTKNGIIEKKNINFDISNYTFTPISCSPLSHTDSYTDEK